MNRGSVLGLLFVSLVATGLLAFSPTVKSSPKTIVVPDDYPTIQAAVGNASSGDTVLVRSGTYDGGIPIAKPISLTGEDSVSTIIVGGIALVNLSFTSTESAAPDVQASISTRAQTAQSPNDETPEISLSNLIGIPPPTYGIYVNSSDVSISGFTFKDNGIPIGGNTERLKLFQNTFGRGASCSLSGSNMTLTNNTGSGLYVQGSFNLIAGNTLHVSLIGSSNAVFENAGGGFFLVGSNNTVVGNNFNDFFMQNANSNIIIDNTVSGANEGLTVGFYGEECSYNLFAGNTVENSGLWGLSMRAGSYNVFYGNLVTGTGKLGHDGYGLTLGGHSFVVDKNLFTHNIFANNAHNFGTNWPVNGANSFDDGDGGNYWDDYLIKYPNSTEMDQSGTGSTPYVLTDNNIDNHPLLSRPNVSDKLPALPEPWASLLPTLSPLPTLPSSPSTTFSPTSSPKTTQNPTVSPPPSSSATPSPSPNLSSTISPTPSSSDQQSASSPEPQQSTFPTELIYLAAGAIAFAVIATAVFVLRRKT